MRAKVQYIPRQVGNLKRFGANFDPASSEIEPSQNRNLLVGRETFSPIMNGHSTTFRTSDPVNSLFPHLDLLMLQCFLIRALWMAGQAGQDMLQTYGPSQPDIQQTSGHSSPDPARLSHATPGLSSDIRILKENPPGKIASAKHRLSSFLSCYSRSKIRWDQTSRLAFKEGIRSG